MSKKQPKGKARHEHRTREITKGTQKADLASSKQKHSAGLTTLTERSLAEKAGHLEMLKGGKKDRLEKAKNAHRK